MGKNSNNISGDRVRTIRKEHKLTQNAFAELIGKPDKETDKDMYCGSYISNVESGSRALPAPMARRIASLFDVSVDWLMGVSDFRTHNDYLISKNRKVINTARKESELLSIGLAAFATLNGYQITPPDLSGSQDVSSVLYSVSNGYTISKDGQAITLSLEEMNRLQNEISDLVSVRLKYLFKEKTAPGE